MSHWCGCTHLQRGIPALQGGQAGLPLHALRAYLRLQSLAFCACLRCTLLNLQGLQTID